MPRQWLSLLIVWTLIGAPSTVAQENRGPDTVILQTATKGEVHVPHKTHQVVLQSDCRACHGLFDPAPGSVARQIAAGRLKKKQVMNQCIACHRQKMGEGLKSGPVGCSACHPGK